MAKRRPQINFQVEPSLKLLYQEAHLAGHWVTRLCAAGMLVLVEDAALRVRALNRLREWEARYAGASPDQIRRFVAGAQGALQDSAPDSPPVPRARAGRKKAGRSGGG